MVCVNKVAMNLADKVIHTPAPQKAEETHFSQEPPPRKQREERAEDFISDDDLYANLPCTD